MSLNAVFESDICVGVMVKYAPIAIVIKHVTKYNSNISIIKSFIDAKFIFRKEVYVGAL